MRYLPFALVGLSFALSLAWAIATVGVFAWALAAGFGALVLLGLYDLVQTRHTIWRNYPITGHIRWIGEWARPYLRAYIVESATEGRPFNHEARAMIYRRAKNVTSVEPFGSMLDMEAPSHEWLAHSVAAVRPDTDDPRVTVGAPGTAQPYSASVFNISAMSFGALGARAIEALNRGAAAGNFYHDTGEGGVSRYHRAGGGDLVYELGSGYFGARTRDGGFDPEPFRELAGEAQVKMVEIKLSQGAKPGHGGVLPGEKVSPEIAEARGIPVGETCASPAAHSAFSNPLELMEFIAELRDLSGGKPVGLKFCVGRPHEVLALCKASLQTGIRPDFLVVDGAEGGTGAAPGEFQDHVGMPLRDGLVFTRNALVGCALKSDIRLAAAGKQVSAFQLAACMALGADWVNTARGFMFSLGCIQSLNCHNNRCPTGIATTDAMRQSGLDIADKAERVAHFHRNTVKALMEVVGAAGCHHPGDLTPVHMMQRLGNGGAAPMNAVHDLLDEGVLLSDPGATPLGGAWSRARADSFAPAV